MRKFTKEITSLLATVAVGVSMGAASATAEENAQLSGQALNPDSITEPAEEEIIHTAGVVVSDNDITEPAVTTTTTTYIPPLEGTVVGTTTTTTVIPPLEGTVVGTTTTTTDIPPLMGDIAPVDGDTNCDGQLDMADAVLIMQALANPNKYGENGTSEYHLTAQGKYNGDMDGDGLTVGDAQKIQMKLLGLSDEKITDLETINSMLTAFFEDNDFTAHSAIKENDEFSWVEITYNSRIPDEQAKIEGFITDKNIDERFIDYCVLL